MIFLRRQLRYVALTAVLATGLFALAGTIQGLSMTPVPPNVSTTQTGATITWSTDQTSGPSHLWSGLAGPTWTSPTGIPGTEFVRDIAVYDTNRAFLVVSCPSGCGSTLGKMYVANRQPGGTYAWSLEASMTFIPNSVVAHDFDTAWVGGYTNSLQQFKVDGSGPIASGSIPNISIVWELAQGGNKVFIAGNYRDLAVMDNATPSIVTALPTNVQATFPSVSTYFEIGAFDDTHIWAAAGAVVSYTTNGSSWSHWGATGGTTIEDISVVAQDEAYAVARSGYIYRMKGATTSTWTATRPTTLDWFSIGAGSPTRLMIFGCCTGSSKDFISYSLDGINWSPLQVQTTFGASQVADFESPTMGMVAGSIAGVSTTRVYAPIYTSASTSNVSGTARSHGLTSLQEAITYHANADAFYPALVSIYSDSAESQDFAFQTTALDIDSGPNTAPLTTTVGTTWSTTIAGNTRFFTAPTATVGWQVKTSVASTQFKDIEAMGDTAFAVGSVSDVIVKSSDLGQTWPSQTGTGNFAEALSMVGLHGFTVGNNIVLKTSDGTSWNAQSPPAGYYFGVDALDDQHAIAVGGILSPTSGTIIRTNDGGTTWSSVFTPAEWLRSVAYLDTNTLVVVGDSTIIYRSVDGGTTWLPVPSGTSANLSRVTAVDSQNAWAVGQNGAMVRTTDGGKTWTSVTACTVSPLFDVGAVSNNDIWVVGSTGTVIHWTQAAGCQAETGIPNVNSGTTVDVRAVSVENGNVWIAGANGTIARKGIDPANPKFKSVVKDTATPVTSHDTGTVSGLDANTAYSYFVQTNDPAGYTTTRSGTFTTLPVPTLEVSVSSLSFTAIESGPDPASQTFDVRGQGNANIGGWTATKTSGGAWLNFAPASGGSTPGTVTVSPNISGLTAAGSPYTGTIQIDASIPGVLNSPQTVNVTLNIQAPPALVLTPGPNPTVDFGTVTSGDPLPAAKVVNVSNGTPATVLNFTVSAAAPWLTMTIPGSTPFPTPNQISLQPNSTAVPGTYATTITVTGQGTVTNSPQTITVTYQIDPGPTLDVTWNGKPAPLSFTATQGGPNPPADTSGIVRNSGGGSMTWNATTTATWLTVSPASDGNGPTGLTIQAITGALGPSGVTPYTANVHIVAGSAGIIDIPVEFTVSAAPVLSVTPSSMEFTTTQGTNPPDQDLDITSGAPAGWSVAATSGLNWLSFTGATSGVPYPGKVKVHVDVITTGLTIGDYTDGVVTVTSTGALPASINVPVTLHVTAPPILDVNPGTLAPFTTEEGKNPAPQTFQISNIGGPSTVMNWTITQPTETWVRLAMTACSGVYPPTLTGSNTVGGAPAVINVCIDTTSPTLLTPNTYNSSFTIASPGTTGAPKTMNVALTVTPDTTGPTIPSSSISIIATADCLANDTYANVRWDTNEYSDSQVYAGEQLVSGVPQYESFAIVTDIVDTGTHTGGVVSHDVLLDNLTGGHRYYVKLQSKDRYGNTSAVIDHDPDQPALYLSFLAPATCDNTPPTNVILTVPPGTLYGSATFNMSAEDQSGITQFTLVESPTDTVITTVSVPPGACTLIGATYSCVVSYTFATTMLPDGSHDLYIIAYDNAGNSAPSPIVTVVIDNAVPTISNITAVPQNIGGVWQATISWDTDKPSNSKIDFGREIVSGVFAIPGDYTDHIFIDDTARDDLTSGADRHRITLNNLIGGQVYHFYLTSCSRNNPLLCGH